MHISGVADLFLNVSFRVFYPQEAFCTMWIANFEWTQLITLFQFLNLTWLDWMEQINRHHIYKNFTSLEVTFDTLLGSFQAPTCCGENADASLAFSTFYLKYFVLISSSDCSHLETM